MNVGAERGQLAVRPQMFTTQQINVCCGITGQIRGNVIYGMSAKVADGIASLMIGQEVKSFDALAASAIAELGNMISGNAMSLLAGQGYECDITPPTIIRGTNVKIAMIDVPALSIPLNVPGVGLFEINVSLQEKQAVAAA